MSKSLKQTVDQLGEVRAQIAELRAQEDRLKSRLIDNGNDSVEGDYFKVIVVRTTVMTCNYRQVTESLRQTPRLKQLLDENRRSTDRISVRVTAR